MSQLGTRNSLTVSVKLNCGYILLLQQLCTVNNNASSYSLSARLAERPALSLACILLAGVQSK